MSVYIVYSNMKDSPQPAVIAPKLSPRFVFLSLEAVSWHTSPLYDSRLLIWLFALNRKNLHVPRKSVTVRDT